MLRAFGARFHRVNYGMTAGPLFPCALWYGTVRNGTVPYRTIVYHTTHRTAFLVNLSPNN